MTDDLEDLRRYDDLCARLYADKRFPPGTRELALAMAWAGLRDPERPGNAARRVARLLGRDSVGRWRHKELFAGDAPRYYPGVGNGAGRCEGPRLRPYRPRTPKPDPGITNLHEPMSYDGRGGAVPTSQALNRPDPGNVCGAAGSIRVPEYDLVSGWLRADHWFCRRHKEHADRVRAQIETAGERPEPIPNVGGLLPCYFVSESWERLYSWARPGWKPPYYGVCADDWPTPGHTVVPRKPRLSLVATG